MSNYQSSNQDIKVIYQSTLIRTFERKKSCHSIVEFESIILKSIMSEEHFDDYEHYNYDHEKEMKSGHSGKQRSKKEAAQNTNHHNPGGHERKIVTKLQNMEANQRKKSESK